MRETLRALLKKKGHTMHSVPPQATVLEAVRKMNQERIGALLVMDGDDLVGIFTERDVLARVVDRTRDPGTTRVAEVMTGNPVVVTAASS